MAHVYSPPAETAITPLDKPTTSTGVNRSIVELSPNRPDAFSPQHFTAPADVMAHVCALPAEIATTPLDKPTTSTGAYRSVVVLSPNCPEAFSPQHFTAPTDVTAHVWFTLPAEIATTPLDKPTTSTGAYRSVVVLSPNCPEVLSPQHFTAPADVTAHVCHPPAEIED